MGLESFLSRVGHSLSIYLSDSRSGASLSLHLRRDLRMPRHIRLPVTTTDSDAISLLRIIINIVTPRKLAYRRV